MKNGFLMRSGALLISMCLCLYAVPQVVMAQEQTPIKEDVTNVE